MTKKNVVSANNSKGTKEIKSSDAIKLLLTEYGTLSFCVKTLNTLAHETFTFEGAKVSGYQLIKSICPNYKGKFDLNLFKTQLESTPLFENGIFNEWKKVAIKFNDNVIYSDANCTNTIGVYTLSRIEKWNVSKVIKMLDATKSAYIQPKKVEKAVKAAKESFGTFYYKVDDATYMAKCNSFSLKGTTLMGKIDVTEIKVKNSVKVEEIKPTATKLQAKNIATKEDIEKRKNAKNSANKKVEEKRSTRKEFVNNVLGNFDVNAVANNA